MKRFIGTKIITAKPMTRQEYNDYRGWELPEDEKSLANESGFLVEYDDLSHQNHPDHKGYISWSPAVVFEKAYREVSGMSFGLATEALLKGQKVKREGWNGEGQFIMYSEPENDFYSIKEGTFKRRPYFYLKNAQDELMPWVPSMGDCLADDWQII